MKWVSVEELVTQLYDVSGPAPFDISEGGAVGYRKGYAPALQETWLPEDQKMKKKEEKAGKFELRELLGEAPKIIFP